MDARDAKKSMKDIDALPIRREEIYAACLRVLRNPHDAEDACQEALIAIAKDAGSVRDERKLAAWARRVATTTALDFRRRLERRRAHESKIRPSAPAPSDELDVHGALQKLDGPEREAVAAHYLDGRPLRELAKEQGVSEVAVWKRLGKAKSKLRLLLAAALPAAIIAASLLVALLRPAAPAPAVPQEEREPWPWELPPRDWPEPMKKSWKALQKKTTLDMRNVETGELLDMMSGFVGQPIQAAPGAIQPGEQVSFKVQDITLEGALRLLLGPRALALEIRKDGSIVVVKAADLDPAADWNRSKAFRDAQSLGNVKRWVGVSKPLARGRADLAKPVDGLAGARSLDDYLAKLREKSGAQLLLEGNQADGRAEVVGLPERLSVETHLRRSLEPLDLEAVPTSEGAILLTRSGRAAELRSSEAYRRQERLEAAVDRPLEAGDVDTVPKLVRRLEKVLGAPVLATQEAWASTASPAPKPGESIASLLDRLKADGIRWTLRDGALYLIK